MSIVYKTLFEVKLTHEFYLTRTNGETIFSFAPQDARLAFLQDHFNADKQSINEALEFKFPENLDPEYSGYHLKLLSTYSGFQVVIRVDQQKYQRPQNQAPARCPALDSCPALMKPSARRQNRSLSRNHPINC